MMKKTFTYLLVCTTQLFIFSCKDKKLTEVTVEVPLPENQEKVITQSSPKDVKATEGYFQLYTLPFEYNALAPHIDSQTMENHYSKHYLTYTNNTNKLLDDVEDKSLSVEDLLKKLDLTNIDLRNNLGGYYNHTLFFEILSPKASEKPTDTLMGAIHATFGDFDNFKKEFSTAAEKQFGSGWAWLVVDKAGKLQITTSQNQDNPLMPKQPIQGTPILCIDVWEHAYYLSYQYKRRKYIDAFFNCIDWKKVQEKYENAIKK